MEKKIGEARGRKEEQEKVHLESANGARRKLAAPEPKQHAPLLLPSPLQFFFSEMFNSLGQVCNIQNAYAIKSAMISK